MTEQTAGVLIVFSQVGFVILLVVVIFLIVMLKRSNRDKKMAKAFVETLKDGELERQGKLSDVLQKVHDMDDKLSKKTAEGMLTCEKQIYNRVIQMYLGRNHDDLPRLRKDVENMAAAYRNLIDKIPETKLVPGESPKQIAQLKARLKQMEAERDKVQHDLDDALTTMDNIMVEYAAMYDGGARKEGKKHIENQISDLKQKLAENENATDIPDLDLPDDISGDSSPS